MKKVIKKTAVVLVMCGSILQFSAQVEAQSIATKTKSMKESVATLHLEVAGMHSQRYCANGTDTLLSHTPGILFSNLLMQPVHLW